MSYNVPIRENAILGFVAWPLIFAIARSMLPIQCPRAQVLATGMRREASSCRSRPSLAGNIKKGEDSDEPLFHADRCGCVVAGSWSPACSQAEDKITYIDLEPQANRKLADNQGRGLDGNDLNNVPTGEQKFGDLMFKIGPKLIQLGSQMLDSLPATVEGITVKKKFTKLYILHATCFGGGPNEPGGIGYVKDGTPIGEYVVHYKDKTTERIPIVYGEEVRDWFFAEGEAEPSKSR